MSKVWDKLEIFVAFELALLSGSSENKWKGIDEHGAGAKYFGILGKHFADIHH